MILVVVGDTDINKLIEFSDIVIGMVSMLLMEASIKKILCIHTDPTKK